jgi:CheY-like chemotaxis protein
VVAGVIHDLNNVFAVILGAAEALAREDTENADLAVLAAAAGRGRAMLRGLLRPQAATVPEAVPPAARALDGMIEGLRGTLGHACGATLRLRLELAAPDVRVAVDPGVLERVLLNLVANARHAVQGAGELVLRSVRPEDDAHGPMAAIELHDSGPGIPPDILARIGEPYVTTKPAGEGTGLGLATVRRLLAEAGGALTIASEPGVGTCMGVRLPIAASPASGGLVLLVEDDAALRRLTERALARQGWRILQAASAEAALDLLEEAGGGLAAVVTDVSLPGMDGEDLAHEIRRRTGRDVLPVVLVSGFVPESAPGPGMLRLAKPYDMRDLATLLASIAPPPPG